MSTIILSVYPDGRFSSVMALDCETDELALQDMIQGAEIYTATLQDIVSKDFFAHHMKRHAAYYLVSVGADIWVARESQADSIEAWKAWAIHCTAQWGAWFVPFGWEAK